MYNERVAINLPLQAANETETKIDEDPPPYQNPQLDFSGGWKNHRFAIFFWIHTIAVILVSIKLGIPVIAPYIKHNAFGKSEQISSNRDIKPLLCGLGGAATVGGLVSFLSFIALQLCAVTFGNIIHFITACSIGHWWFPIEVSQQYTIGTSIKRAFTTNFGTICFGSFFEAIIKSLRSSTKEHRRKSILSCIFGCILQMIDDCIGYLNEWAFIYAALTGQGFVQASRSFLTLFQARGWTAIINDSLVGTTLFMINFVIGVISAVAGEELSSINLKYLKYVSRKLDYIHFVKFEKIIKNFFYHVQILRITTCYDQAYINAKQWEELILLSMPYLRILDINHEDSIQNNDLKYHDLIKQFNSSF
ncbi:unnamed protein product [Rotaria sp. Silwood1]|nr:unnamed protein product [Rotaria sp. Silwood1]CAF1135808.1 unnamed protein product [Rotaria sp. Silwood1]